MQNKLKALLFALFFPFMHLALRAGVQTLAAWAALARVRARFPELSDEYAGNQANLEMRTAAPWLLIASSLLTLAAVILLLRFLRIPPREFAGTGRLRPVTVLTIIEIGLGLNLALSAMTTLLPLPQSWAAEHSRGVSDPLAAAGPAAFFLCAVIAVPLAEEAVYRGLAFRFLRSGFSPVMALLWQAVLFAAFHGTKLQMVYVFPAAVALGLVYVWCGTLAAPLVLHMTFNAYSVFSLPLPGAVWGRCVCLLAGAAITGFGLHGVWSRSKAKVLPVPPNRFPRPPRQ
ncbi:MAG: CPBP family intramembrane metalloprotease [Oscillospiraceae bacterium]|jgi:membrane protease YdiL (CAAX protease family)|nr:CPBP family intramembrane metalloprotease [Oscillospiraceae bacterium]